MNMKIAFEEKCPRCNSNKVYDCGTGHSTGNNHSSSTRTIKWTYECEECNHRFSINDKNIKQ